MQTLIHIVEYEVLGALLLFGFAYFAVMIALRFITGWHKEEKPQADEQRAE
jgi:hypothetical protein